MNMALKKGGGKGGCGGGGGKGKGGSGGGWDGGGDAGDMMAQMMQMMQTMMASMGSGGEGGKGNVACGKGMKPGDWNCPSCGHHNFARNLACQMCGAAKPGAAILDEAFKMVLPADPSEVDQFVATYGIEAHAIPKLKAMDPRLQRAVISKDMGQVRDPTAILIGRCKKLLNLQQGDWVCPSCFDIQFSRKTVCTMCGGPRPQ